MKSLHKKKSTKMFAWSIHLLFTLSLIGLVCSCMLYNGRYADEKDRISLIDSEMYAFEDLGVHSFKPSKISSSQATRNARGRAGTSIGTKEVTVYSLYYQNTGESDIGYTKDYGRDFFLAERALENNEILTFRVLESRAVEENGDLSGTFSRHYLAREHTAADYIAQQKLNLRFLELFMLCSLILPLILAPISAKINHFDKARKQCIKVCLIIIYVIMVFMTFFYF